MGTSKSNREERLEVLSTAGRQAREHRVIRAAVHCAQNLLDRALEDWAASEADALVVSAFFADYVERWHFEYEEEVVLPFLYRTFGDFMGEPMQRVLKEHEESRASWRAVEAAYRALETGGPRAIADFTARFRQYLEHLGEHARTEDVYLFKALDGILTPDEHEELEVRIVSAEERSFGRGVPALLEEKMRRLCERYGAHWPFAPEPR